jgi:hypothetical protein
MGFIPRSDFKCSPTNEPAIQKLLSTLFAIYCIIVDMLKYVPHCFQVWTGAIEGGYGISEAPVNHLAHLSGLAHVPQSQNQKLIVAPLSK